MTRGVGLSVGRRARAAGRVTRRRGVGRVLGPCWRGGKTGAGRARLQAECGVRGGRAGVGLVTRRCERAVGEVGVGRGEARSG